MAAAIGVERAEQAMLANHFAQSLERRGRPFFLDQQHRIDVARRIVQRDDQVHRRAGLRSSRGATLPGAAACRKRTAWTLLRCAERSGAFRTKPAVCNASLATV